MAEAAVVVTDDNFKELTASGVSLVDFWATWCPPCRMQGPVVEKVAEAFKGRAVVGKLDVDEASKTAGGFKVMAVPTIIVFKNGEEHRRLVGAQSEEALAKALEEALSE